ncbi:hypothetical protein C2845_PM02G34430 [Panicum miliaceum]|uniref:Uncharacterized protein n=1 Tax=Panicum miliaceum TaxID=4540 RepID=A0A3L6SF20_PANMI|nr:hypothetical protein C2845_PM02G34430 [Panicum miliaceum]
MLCTADLILSTFRDDRVRSTLALHLNTFSGGGQWHSGLPATTRFPLRNKLIIRT